MQLASISTVRMCIVLTHTAYESQPDFHEDEADDSYPDDGNFPEVSAYMVYNIIIATVEWLIEAASKSYWFVCRYEPQGLSKQGTV